MSLVETFQLWMVAFITLALFSFMYKDNPAYRVVEHIFAGLTAGYQVGLIWETVIMQQLFTPLFEGGRWWLFVPGVLGFLMFTRFSSKMSWVSRTSLAFVMGTTAGIFLISELHGRVLPQMQDTMIPRSEKLAEAEDPYENNAGKFTVVEFPYAIPEVLPDTSSPVALPRSDNLVVEPGNVTANTDLVLRYGNDTVVLGADFLDPIPLRFGEYHVVTYEIRNQLTATSYALASSTVYGNDGIGMADRGNGRVETEFKIPSQAQLEHGVYDVKIKVERRSVMFFLTVIIIAGVLSTLVYFYFSHEHKGALGVTARIGIWFIMISFGAHFGYTVMGRVSLLIGRVQFLVEDWIGSFL